MNWLSETLREGIAKAVTWVRDQLSLAFEDCAKNPRVWVVVAIAFAAGCLIGGL